MRPHIVVAHPTKEYNGVTAVDDLSFTVEPSRVTGYLGPIGARKTTTMRMLLESSRLPDGRVASAVQIAVNPLSTKSWAPLTKDASSLSRKSAALATSSGSHMRPCWAAMASSDTSTPWAVSHSISRWP